MIVVDTTVWIDFLEAKGTAFDRHLTDLLERGASIAPVDIVHCEVLQGIRDEDTYQRTRASLLAHVILRPSGLDTFETATNLYRIARRRGLTIRRTVDCLTCQGLGSGGLSAGVRLDAAIAGSNQLYLG